MMRDLIFHLLVLWLVLGALLVATSSLVSARDRHDEPIDHDDVDDEQPVPAIHASRPGTSRSGDTAPRVDESWRPRDTPVNDADGARLAF